MMDHDRMVDVIEHVLTDYLDQVDPENVDTQDLADNVATALERDRERAS